MPNNGPPVPDFGSIGTQSSNPVTPQTAAEQRAAASRVQSAKDIWDLGKLYGRPIYLGDAPSVSGVQSPGAGPAGAELGMGEASPESPAFGQTQQWMQDVSKIWATDPAEYQALQAQLAQAGYYGTSGKYVPGRFDASTQTALKSMLQDYESGVVSAKIPLTIDEFLAQNAQATSAAAAATANAPVATHVSLTDPATIRAAAVSAFESAVGKRPTGSQLDAFVSQFQASQASSQSSEQTAVARKQDSATSSPDVSTDAMQFAQQQDPKAYANYKASGYENALLNLFLPSESQRANITPIPAA